ncbi:FAD-dependent oxidoreductase [Sphingomonas changnyeongensis]|uniref:FAD-dependent oxidoreductase n=1 Tax=Sphingomonas changnyeongensis TaxID=2698679 RepID=A0A7Z2S7W0_9SPHN|nr:FAD-dependent oxidoreductase [Sphingomonas changnyeongensis]QHL90736.1 FAD-dependent oxidoreductase [Sphingomonas changnyeongensis]
MDGSTAEFLIIGGGVAGLSAAAALAPNGRTVVLEAEAATGTHSSGRSVTFSHYGIGGATVRGMTAWSRAFFLDPPDGFDALCRVTPALFVATPEMRDELGRLEAITRGLTDQVERLDDAGMAALCPVLRFGPDAITDGFVHHEGLRLDPHAMLTGYARQVRRHGGSVVTGARVAAIARTGTDWQVTTGTGERCSAPVLINAAGAWADGLAALAGVAPLGLSPLRRTVIAFDPSPGQDVRAWPFVKTATDHVYFLPDGGRLLASPVDEHPDQPGDAQPEEIDMAIAADRVMAITRLDVRRITHKWAGLRTFTADRVPVAGWATDAPGFFWLAGQGGYGLQTAPAMAQISAALITGTAWPEGLTEAGAPPAAITPNASLPPASDRAGALRAGLRPGRLTPAEDLLKARAQSGRVLPDCRPRQLVGRMPLNLQPRRGKTSGLHRSAFSGRASAGAPHSPSRTDDAAPGHMPLGH